MRKLIDCIVSLDSDNKYENGFIFKGKVSNGNSVIGFIKCELVRCKDCKWYDERISMCNNCGLPREQTFFCADGKRR